MKLYDVWGLAAKQSTIELGGGVVSGNIGETRLPMSGTR